MKKAIVLIVIAALFVGVVFIGTACKTQVATETTISETTATSDTAKTEETTLTEETTAQQGYMANVGTIKSEDYKAMFRKSDKPLVIGFANNIRSAPYCQIVEDSMAKYCKEAGVELFAVDNNLDEVKVIDNARTMITKKVDFFVEFSSTAETNDEVAIMMEEANIPVLYVDNAPEGKLFYGADNYYSGTLGGEWLVDYYNKNWSGKEVIDVIFDWSQCGLVCQTRMDGFADSLAKGITGIKVERVDTAGTQEDTVDKMRTWLTANPDAKNIFVNVIYDAPGLGVLAALQEQNRESDCVIMSCGADPSVYEEIRDPDSAYKGSVGYFPEEYGKDILAVAFDVLEGKQVPEKVFINHVVIDAVTVNQYYPVK